MVTLAPQFAENYINRLIFMSSNRRGFIGIFSQNQHQDDARETEREVISTGEKPAKKDDFEPLDRASPIESSSDSDWNDIFEDSPRNDYPAPASPAVNPVAAAMAVKPDHEPSGESKPEQKQRDDVNDPEPEPIIQTVNETTGTDAADKNTTYSTKVMHNGPSSKSILSKSDRQAISDAIQTLREKLSFAREASGEQRDGLMKLGATGRDFISQATKVVGENPDVLPRSFDDESFVTDAELVETLRNIGNDLRDLTRRVADTESKIASSAFAGALLVHRSSGLDADKGKSDVYRKSSGNHANGSTQTERERDNLSMNRVGV